MRPKYFDILLVLILLITAIFTGFYFEELTDIAYAVFFTGLLQSAPGSIFNNYECLFGIARLVQVLQVHVQHINVWGLVLVLINTYCIYLFISLFYQAVYQKFKRSIVFILTIAFCLLIANDYILVQFTKTSIFCVFLGFYYLLHEPGKKFRSLILILIGLLLRGEAFWLILLLSIAVHYITYGNAFWPMILKRKYMWLGLLVIGVTVSVMNKKIYTADDARYSSFRAYKYSLVDFRPETNKKLSDRDSLKLYAMQNFFFGDKDSLLETSTFNRLGVTGLERFSFLSSLNVFSKNELKLKGENVSILLKAWKELYLLWISIVLLAAMLCYQIQPGSLKRLAGVILFALLYVTAITVYIKMESRVLHPILLITLFYVFRLFFRAENKKPLSAVLYIPLLAAVLFSYLLFYKIYFVVNDRIKLDRQATAFISEWKKNNSDDILVPDLHSWQLFTTRAMYDPSLSGNIKMISLDDGYMCMMQNHLDYMYAITGSNHFKDYLAYIQSHKEKIYFLGTEARTELIENYIRKIYGLDFHLAKAKETPVVSGHGPTGYLEFFLYRIQ